jgi:peptidoglycan/LPS O-acetylase OafA/YrhL
MTKQRRHIDFLDAIRGCAALAVFLFHVRHAVLEYLPVNKFTGISDILKDGWMGVAVFFALSGFCIHLSHIRSVSHGWSTYFSKRFCRIVPSYVVALLTFVTLTVIFDGYRAVSIPDAVVHLLGLHNFVPSFVHSFNGSFWSIAVEMQLYVLYPLVFIVQKRFGWWAALLLTGCMEAALRFAVVFNMVPGGDFGSTFVSMLPTYFWFSWTVGAFAADNYHHGRISNLGKLPPLLALCLCVAVLNVTVLSHFRFPLISILAASCLERWSLGTTWSPNVQGVVGRHLTTLGTVSYSFYLYHQPFMNFIFKASTRSATNPTVLILMLVTGVILLYIGLFHVAKLLYRVVELRKPSVMPSAKVDIAKVI